MVTPLPASWPFQDIRIKWWTDVIHCYLCPAGFASRSSHDWLLLMLHLAVFVTLRKIFPDHRNSTPTPIPTTTMPAPRQYSLTQHALFSLNEALTETYNGLLFTCFSAPTTTAEPLNFSIQCLTAQHTAGIQLEIYSRWKHWDRTNKASSTKTLHIYRVSPITVSWNLTSPD